MSEDQKLIELAERCEAATGPDRELDAAIALLHGWTVHKGDNWIGPHGQISVPEFTGSLDAALTLVPERWSCSVAIDETGRHAQAVLGRSHPTNKNVYQEGRTRPLVTIAAALRAIAANA